MRHRARIQPYVTPELRRQIAAHSAAQVVTESAYIEAGMRKYVEGHGVDEGLVIRRLDALTHAVAKAHDDVQVLAQAFSWFVKFSFMVAPVPGPEARGRADFLRSGWRRMCGGWNGWRAIGWRRGCRTGAGRCLRIW
jgi:hypothetical protein